MPSQTDPTRFDVGILCVHGVGEPLRGQTLVEVGDTLYSWLDGWLKCASNPMPGAASISYAQVHRVEFAREPSFAAVHIRAGEIEQNWLIAESWWARDFIRPSFGQLVYWAFSVVPFTLTSHFASKLTRARGVYQSVAAFGEFVLSIPGALALYAVTIIVALIGLVPIEAFRSFAASIQRAVSATIGDSYIFVESPIQHAAMMSQVGKDLTWLAERCDAIVLVAHSQGAAVAYDELSSGSAPLPGLLITLGSGINKLSALRKSEAGGRERAFSRVLGKFSYIALAGSLFAEPGALWKKLLKDYGVIVVWISMILQEARNLSGEPASEAAKQLELPWLDFYARADPVPNGPLFATDTTRAQRSIEVRNRDSFFFDHTSYWNNRDEFVSQVFAAIAGVTSAPIPVPNTSAIVTASARRSLRVRTLALYRMVALALFALAVIAHWPELPTVWSSTEASLNRATMRLGFATPIHKVPSGTEGLAGLTVVAVLFVLCYLPSSLLWSWWDRQEMERLFQPRKYQAATSLLIFQDFGLKPPALAGKTGL